MYINPILTISTNIGVEISRQSTFQLIYREKNSIIQSVAKMYFQQGMRSSKVSLF